MELKKEIINDLKKIEWYDDRFYKYIETNGEVKYLPSVTTVLSIINKPFLSSWRGSVGNFEADRISEIAKNKGSKIHNACELLTNGKEVVYNGYEQNEWMQICRYVEFLKIINPVIIETEKIIYDSVRGYAGTADLIFRIKDKVEIKNGTELLKLDSGLYLLDIKTGASINENEYYMQLAAYFFGLKIEGLINENLVGAFILHLNAKNKTGYKIYYKGAEELEEDFNAFLNCLSLFNRKALKIEPKIIEMPDKLKWEYTQPDQVFSYLWVEPDESKQLRKKRKININKKTKLKTKKIKEIKL